MKFIYISGYLLHIFEKFRSIYEGELGANDYIDKVLILIDAAIGSSLLEICVRWNI